jgi:hypothetical protein
MAFARLMPGRLTMPFAGLPHCIEVPECGCQLNIATQSVSIEDCLLGADNLAK